SCAAVAPATPAVATTRTAARYMADLLSCVAGRYALAWTEACPSRARSRALERRTGRVACLASRHACRPARSAAHGAAHALGQRGAARDHGGERPANPRGFSRDRTARRSGPVVPAAGM